MSFVTSASMTATAFGPVSQSSPMCDTSNNPARCRTASCSAEMPLYWTGISNPANGTIRAFQPDMLIKQRSTTKLAHGLRRYSGEPKPARHGLDAPQVAPDQGRQNASAATHGARSPLPKPSERLRSNPNRAEGSRRLTRFVIPGGVRRNPATTQQSRKETDHDRRRRPRRQEITRRGRRRCEVPRRGERPPVLPVSGSRVMSAAVRDVKKTERKQTPNADASGPGGVPSFL